MPAPTTSENASEQPRLVVSVDWLHAAVLLRGELDRDSAHHLVDAAAALSATDHPYWVIDTADVTWCDVGGLRALAAVHALATSHGRQLRLVRTSRCVDRLVSLSGLDQVIADARSAAILAAAATAPPAARTIPGPRRPVPVGG